MTEHVHRVAVAMEKAGAGVAVGSWFTSWVGWLGEHSQVIMSTCGLIGAVVGVMGALLNLWYRRLENDRLADEHRARMDVLRSGRMPDA